MLTGSSRIGTIGTELLKRAAISHGRLGGRRFSSLAVTFRAAQDDQGVALGWHQLVHPLINDKRLVRFTDLVQPAPWKVTI